MKLTSEERHLLITKILNGSAISSVAAELKCPKSTASKIFETAITRIFRHVGHSKNYSIEQARQDKKLVEQHLEDYLNGSWFTEYKGLEPSASIYHLNIKSNIANPLVSKNISTIEQLINYPKCKLLNIDGIGKRAVEKIEIALKEQGFSLNT
tara:strand:- start:3569 stop:4027 length:459 start_codon:yes stop_codon:yes gene_type:complete